jgi:hypothetical protein
VAAPALRRLGRAGLEALPRSAYADGAQCSKHHFPLKITVARKRFEKFELVVFSVPKAGLEA